MPSTGIRWRSGRLRTGRRRKRRRRRHRTAGQTPVSQRERRGDRRTRETTTATTVPRLSRTGAFQFRIQHGNGHEVQHHQERTAQRAQAATATGKSVAVATAAAAAEADTLFVAADCPSTADYRRRHRRRTISPHIADVEPPRVLNVTPLRRLFGPSDSPIPDCPPGLCPPTPLTPCVSYSRHAGTLSTAPQFDFFRFRFSVPRTVACHIRRATQFSTFNHHWFAVADDLNV